MRYLVWYKMRFGQQTRWANGPYDYRANALRERDDLFARNADMQLCWITKGASNVETGKVLERKWTWVDGVGQVVSVKK